MNHSFDARSNTASPDVGDTEATALAGIASEERTSASRVKATGRGVRNASRPASVTAVGRILAGSVALCALGAFAFAGGAAGSGPAQGSTAIPNGVHAYGRAIDHGPSASMHFNRPVVGIASTRNGAGYWITASDGGVFTFGDAHFYGSTGNLTLAGPVVAIASTPTDHGYWLAASDGGVFTFGDAHFYGSKAGATFSPIVGIASTPTGKGYFLVAANGEVSAFGDAQFVGDPSRLVLQGAIVGIATAPNANGYWLLGADGGVFAYGRAKFHGAATNPFVSDAVSIAATPDGAGYIVARKTGAVVSFVPGLAAAADLAQSTAAPTVAVGARIGGYWTLQSEGAPITDHLDPFLVCTRSHESSSTAPNYDDGYGAIDPSGTYRGAYQFDRPTWNSTARMTGRFDLVGVDPATATVADQDFLALALYHSRGAAPWVGRCAGLA